MGDTYGDIEPTVVADTDSEVVRDNHCFALAGLPGCGKSTAADIIVDELKANYEYATHTEVSDYVRAKFQAQSDDTVNDNELGRWAADKKAEHGNGYFLRGMVQHWTHERSPHVAISGLRSPAEAEAVRDGFGEDCTVIAIWTLPDIRFERKYGEVPSEEHEEWDTFVERNERETFDWGCVEYFTSDGVSDYVVPNNGTVEELDAAIRAIVREEALDGSKRASLYQEPPFPHDDQERVAQYL